MNEQVRIKIGDNNDSSYSAIIIVGISENAQRILRNYEMNEYDAIWEDLISTIEDLYPRLPEDWFIDKIYWN